MTSLTSYGNYAPHMHVHIYGNLFSKSECRGQTTGCLAYPVKFWKIRAQGTQNTDTESNNDALAMDPKQQELRILLRPR